MTSLDTCRDIIILCPDAGDDLLVSAVDSCGAIGEKPGDIVRIDAELAAWHTARVVLLEVMSVGARPEFASLSVCNEPETAERLLKGVRRALGKYAAIPVVISTEKNMPTSMTAFGITFTGTCKRADLRVGHAKTGDLLFCAGLPLVGGEMLQKDAPFFTVPHLEKLCENPLVHTVIPCGSHGIAAEAEVLAAESGLKPVLSGSTGLDLAKSAGPASCAVFAADLPAGCDFGLGIPVTCIGQLV